MDITEADVKRLLDEAGAAGDLAQVELCRFALAGDAGAWAQCEEAIRDAQAQGERRTTMEIMKSCATVEGLMERHDDKDAALQAAASAGAHVHEEEDVAGPGYVYAVCDDERCETS